MTSFFTLLTKCLYSLTPPHEELMTTNDRHTARLLSLSLSFFLFLSVCVCHTKSFFAFQNNNSTIIIILAQVILLRRAECL